MADKSLINRDMIALQADPRFRELSGEQQRIVLGAAFDREIAPKYAGIQGADMGDI